MMNKQTTFLGVLFLMVLLLGALYVTNSRPFSGPIEVTPLRHIPQYQHHNACLTLADLDQYAPQKCSDDCQAKHKSTIQAIIKDLLEVRAELLAVWRFSQGEKARKHTRNALHKVENQLRSLGLSKLPPPFNSRPDRRSEDLCPEKRQSSTVDPSLKFNYVLEPCSYGKPLESLVTVAINFAGAAWDGIDTMKRVISGIRTYNKALRVVVAISEDNPASQIPELKTGIEVVQIPKVSANNAGITWNALIQKTKTPYILIGRALEWFTGDVKLERLIREIAELGVSIVAGSSRTLSDGHWSMGCHQTDLMNYTLKYQAGYFESMHECVFCDYITGPFVTRTENMAKLKFDETSFTTEKSEGLFEDLFFRLREAGGESVVCPDSIFFKRQIDSSSKKVDWQAFARKWKFSRLVAVGGHDLKYTCKEISTGCPTTKGLALAPCCLQDLADGLKFLSRFCDENNMTCESVGGTILGALKFDTVLPWERDGDIRFLSSDYRSVKSLKSKFSSAGYKISFSDGGGGGCTPVGGSARLGTPGGWGVDFWAVCIETSESLEFAQKGLSPTKINIDGEWINARRSPGSYCRDRYGEDIYTHVEHYFTFGGNSYSKYVPGYFAPCPAKNRVERSGCLDQYFPDGSIQFG